MAQKANAEVAMLAKAVSSLTGGGGAGSAAGSTSGINKPAILSAIIRNASGQASEVKTLLS